MIFPINLSQSPEKVCEDVYHTLFEKEDEEWTMHGPYMVWVLMSAEPDDVKVFRRCTFRQAQLRLLTEGIGSYILKCKLENDVKLLGESADFSVQAWHDFLYIVFQETVNKYYRFEEGNGCGVIYLRENEILGGCS